jgi:hypothetical protein
MVNDGADHHDVDRLRFGAGWRHLLRPEEPVPLRTSWSMSSGLRRAFVVRHPAIPDITIARLNR